MTRKAYSVGQVNAYIKNMFTQDFLLHSICIKGEVSNCKYHSSGHIYFTIKDEKGAIAAVMFAGNRKGLGFRMQEGDKVFVTGSVEVYERDGKYQMYAREIEKDGAGDLFLQFEALKRELEEMGMFAPEYKKTIPKYIHTLGVVTAPTGAAVQDIQNITRRRNPYVQIILYPAQVQGDGAARSIANGIRALDAYGVDTMIVGRGGGSMEDLWAFNEETVARAIFECQTPVISAVGHETDTTIADFVADLRAPTPSAAAEQAVYEANVLLDVIAEYNRSLKRGLSWKLDFIKNRCLQYAARVEKSSPKSRLNEKKQYALTLEDRLEKSIESRLMEARYRIGLLSGRLDGASPLKKLSQGLAFVTNDRGKRIAAVKEVKKGDRICIRLQDGSLQADVTAKQLEKEMEK